jgi:hypothetical protein
MAGTGGISIKEFLKSRRDRVLGSIMGHAERRFFPKLTREEQQAFRTCVMDALNSYHDTVLDLLKSDDPNVVRNDALIGLLQRVEAALDHREVPSR